MTREEAIKVVKEFINGTCLHLVDQEALETLIPELKESEDEKIRKEMIRYFTEMKKGGSAALPYDDCITYLEKQKEQKSNVLQNAFNKSKKDYTLEEKSKASDYAESILPTSVMYGESEEEYKLHTIIEAAFIAGQKEKKPAEWSEEDERKYQCIRNILLTDMDKKVGSWKYSEILEWYEKRGIGRYTNSKLHWKPSEEQMKAIKHAYNSFPNDCPTKSNLRLLYYDLEKLM